MGGFPCSAPERSARDVLRHTPELAGLSPPELVDAYYVSLLHSFGCTSDATEQTQLFGDDIEPRAKFALVDGGNPEEVGAFLMDVVGQGRPPEVREAMVADALENALEIARSTFALHCEVAERFAGWLGFGPGVISNLAYAFERWMGTGSQARPPARRSRRRRGYSMSRATSQSSCRPGAPGERAR